MALEGNVGCPLVLLTMARALSLYVQEQGM